VVQGASGRGRRRFEPKEKKNGSSGDVCEENEGVGSGAPHGEKESVGVRLGWAVAGPLPWASPKE
jgi:hypothetical protein